MRIGYGISNVGSCASYIVYPGCPSGQFKAEYYNNRYLSGSPTFTRCDGSINYDWGGGGPGNGVGNDNFSVRWTGRFNFSGGNYTFIARADDGIRVWVDGNMIIDAWRDQAPTEYRANRSMSSGEHEVKVEYYENGGGAVAQVRWESGGGCTPGANGVVLYEHPNYQGRCVTFTEDDNDFNNDNFNDIASAIRFVGSYASGWEAVVYEHTYYGGVSSTFWGDDSDFGNDTIGHDRASSIRIHRRTSGFFTGWENGEPNSFVNRLEYYRTVAGYYNTWNPPPEAGRVTQEAWAAPMSPGGGSYYLRVAGYRQSSYSYAYFRIFDTNITIQPGMKLRYYIYNFQGNTFAIDGHFTDGSTIRDLHNGGYLIDQNGVRIHPAARWVYPTSQWLYVEVDLTRAAGRTLDYLMVAYDNGNNGYVGQFRAYLDRLGVQ